ncbi:MAG TPA: hypothetical protein VKP30_14480 [Polyangiaceae bacterium]|nr:hypothetical protein [Polyangiaceae bacterium]
MKTGARKEGDVNRLVDMVVEEVSLVDRAANNRQFLIVKRDQSMDEDADTDKAAELDVNDDSPGAANSAALNAALSALESLTAIVEAISATQSGDPSPRLTELAGELRTAADQIASWQGHDPLAADDADSGETSSGDTASDGGAQGPAAQAKAKTGSKAKAPPGKAKAKKPPPKFPPKRPKNDDAEDEEVDADDEEDDENEELEAAKSTIGKIARLLESVTKANKPDVASVPDSSSAGLATTVSKLAHAVQQLTQSFNEQQQRLGRVEKQFGLPNSAASTERSSKSSDDAIGWPLDLNHPMDRQSIDKSVSFHDP